MERGKPRTNYFYGKKCEPWFAAYGTWVEDESICYPSGRLGIRRARVMCPDGKLRIKRTGIADTYFSLPVTPNTGYISKVNDHLKRQLWFFFPYQKEGETKKDHDEIVLDAVLLWVAEKVEKDRKIHSLVTDKVERIKNNV